MTREEDSHVLINSPEGEEELDNLLKPRPRNPKYGFPHQVQPAPPPSNPEIKETTAKGFRQKYSPPPKNPGIGRTRSEAAIESWQNPKTRTRRIKGMRRAVEKRNPKEENVDPVAIYSEPSADRSEGAIHMPNRIMRIYPSSLSLQRVDVV